MPTYALYVLYVVAVFRHLQLIIGVLEMDVIRLYDQRANYGDRSGFLIAIGLAQAITGPGM